MAYNAQWSRGGQKGKIKELKIVFKDLGRSSEENLREKNHEFFLSGSYAQKAENIFSLLHIPVLLV